MSFDSLKRNILKEAANKIREIKVQTEKQLRHEEKRITKLAQAIEEKILDQADAQAVQAGSKLHQERQLQAKADVLASKQSELEQTEQDTVNAILAWDDKQAKGLIKALLDKLPKQPGEIIPGEKHANIVRDLVSKQDNWQVSPDTIPQDGGLVFRDEKTEINLGVRHLVRQLFTRHRTEIAKHLFN